MHSMERKGSPRALLPERGERVDGSRSTWIALPRGQFERPDLAHDARILGSGGARHGRERNFGGTAAGGYSLTLNAISAGERQLQRELSTITMMARIRCGSEGRGHRFESCRARHSSSTLEQNRALLAARANAWLSVSCHDVSETEASHVFIMDTD